MAKALEISKIHNAGDANKEYVILKVLSDTNLMQYAIFDKTFDGDGNETDIFRHIYFFPPKSVKKDEYISLWTKAGKYEKGELDNGKPVHRFYWGSKQSIWNDEGDTATLIEYVVIDKHN